MSRVRSIRGKATLVLSPVDRAETPPPRLRGLGDAVAILAEPIARALHLDPAKCGCARRREKLNRLLPFTSALPKQD